MNVCAASSEVVTKDGISVQMFTDKDFYELGESVRTKIQVDNQNSKEISFWTTVELPDGVLSGNEKVRYEAILQTGETWSTPDGIEIENIIDAEDKETAEVTENVEHVEETEVVEVTENAGEKSRIGGWIILLVLILCAVTVFIVYKKKKGIWFPMLLLLVTIGSLVKPALLVQAENKLGEIKVECTILVDGKEADVVGTVNYVIYDDEEVQTTNIALETLSNTTTKVEQNTNSNSENDSDSVQESTTNQKKEETTESEKTDESEEPENPEEPENTDEPKSPEEPENPGEPENPEEPETPNEPENPEVPEDTTIVSYWNFEGEDALKDKATAGNTTETITLSGNAIISEGVLKVSAAANDYASIACNQENSDLYDLKNKTIIFKARISNNEGSNNSGDGLISKESAYTLYVENAETNRQSNFFYKVPDNEKNTTATVEQSTTTVNEWRVYAISMEVDEENSTGTLKVWKSTVENPSNASDYQLIVSEELSSLPEGLFEGTDTLYLGKRYSDLTKDRSMICEYSMIQVHDEGFELYEILT